MDSDMVAEESRNEIEQVRCYIVKDAWTRTGRGCRPYLRSHDATRVINEREIGRIESLTA
jgi:hypothetical protein